MSMCDFCYTSDGEDRFKLNYKFYAGYIKQFDVDEFDDDEFDKLNYCPLCGRNVSGRKKQYYNDVDKVWQYYQPKGTCSCGCNVYHYEYDGKKIYGVCNACGEDVYILKDEYVEEILNKGIWK